MLSTADTIALSRILIPPLGLLIWAFYYMDARLAYRMPRGLKRYCYQLALVLGSVVIFILQVQLMERFALTDLRGAYFKGFVLVEGSGVLVAGFAAILRERSRSTKQTSKNSNTAQGGY